MLQVIQGLQRIIDRWTRTKTPLTSDLLAGETQVTLRSTAFFKVGDEVLIRDGDSYEKPENLRIKSLDSNTQLTLNRPLSKNWLISQPSLLCKIFGGKLVEGIYLGEPENIPKFPAITINGVSEGAEWLTLDSVKDSFNVQIAVYFEDSTHEFGYVGLLELSKLIKRALAHHIFPLINDYEVIALTADGQPGDYTIKVEDVSLFCPGNMILIEDPYKTIEDRIDSIDEVNSTITLKTQLPHEFMISDGATVILPKRFIFNSYPKDIQYGKIHKGTLLKAGVIDWFGWEEVVTPTGGGGWSAPSIK